MKKALETMEHFAKLGLGSKDTPYLDDTEKIGLMSEYFEIILDCIDGRLVDAFPAPSMGGCCQDDPAKQHEEDSYEETKGYISFGGGCGCGGNCVCGKES
jgi:hypothetical protein